jgi:hypothetical protein
MWQRILVSLAISRRCFRSHVFLVGFRIVWSPPAWRQLEKTYFSNVKFCKFPMDSDSTRNGSRTGTTPIGSFAEEGQELRRGLARLYRSLSSIPRKFPLSRCALGLCSGLWHPPLAVYPAVHPGPAKTTSPCSPGVLPSRAASLHLQTQKQK